MARLTEIVWPLVRERLKELKREAELRGDELLIIEAAVLREAGWDDLVDEVWLVRSPIEAVRARLADRGLTATDAEARLAAQQAMSTNLTGAHVVIDNDSDLATLERRVEVALKAVLERHR
jgi:dephospho-CoA kinase